MVFLLLMQESCMVCCFHQHENHGKLSIKSHKFEDTTDYKMNLSINYGRVLKIKLENIIKRKKSTSKP